MLLDLAIFITLLAFAVRACKAILSESVIFSEFNQSKVVASLVFLYPFGVLIKIFGAAYMPKLFAFGLAVACYMPALFIARKQSNQFQLSGTDRVRGAAEALTSVISGAFLGLIYLSVIILITYASSSYTGK
jgi:hypothetical protein